MSGSQVWGDHLGQVLLDSPVGHGARSTARFGNQIALRLLAEGAAAEAEAEVRRVAQWGPQVGAQSLAWARLLWADTLVYLVGAGVLTSGQADVGLAVMGAEPWPGTLEDLVAAARVVVA